jgi:hypothetical protein
MSPYVVTQLEPRNERHSCKLWFARSSRPHLRDDDLTGEIGRTPFRSPRLTTLFFQGHFRMSVTTDLNLGRETPNKREYKSEGKQC